MHKQALILLFCGVLFSENQASGAFTVFETCPPGCNPTSGMVTISGYRGTKFYLTNAVTLTRIGGVFMSPVGTDAVVVKLTGPNDVPDSVPLSTLDVVARATLYSTNAQEEVSAPIRATLLPGDYALLLGGLTLYMGLMDCPGSS